MNTHFHRLLLLGERNMYRYMAACFCLIIGLFYFCSHEEIKNIDREPVIVLGAARDLAAGPKETYFTSSTLKVWEPLIGLSKDGRIEPKLAISWENRNDSKEWIFHLRKDVIFHDGVPFNAKAVLANFERYQNMGLRATSYYYFTMDRIYPNFEKIEADDEYTVHLYFKNPVPLLPYRMVEWGSAMYSPKSFNAQTGDFEENIAGTGPFRLIERKADEYVLLERNDTYYGEKAKTRRIKIRVIPSMDARYSALRSGEIMGVLDLGGISPLMARELERAGRFSISEQKSTISHYISFNGTHFPFNDSRMKKALNLAIDREKIVHYYFNDYGTSTINFLNSLTPFSKIYPVLYDKKQAEQLANDVIKGERVKVKFLLTRSSLERYPYKVIAEFLQADLSSLGLDIEIQLADDMAASIMKQNGDYDMTIGIRGLDNLDPYRILYDFFDSKGTSNIRNNWGYKNDQIDTLFSELHRATTFEEEKDIYQKIQDILIQDPAIVPLLEGKNIVVSSKKLKGYDASIYGASLESIQWAQKGEEG